MDMDMEGDKIYMAPEVLDGIFDKPADIFSLGLLLLELSANIELPTQGDSWQCLRSGIFDEITFEDISDDMVSLIYSMLHPNPKERPIIADIIHEAYAHVPHLQQQQQQDGDQGREESF
jgi:serine/threonine protein kinase